MKYQEETVECKKEAEECNIYVWFIQFRRLHKVEF